MLYILQIFCMCGSKRCIWVLYSHLLACVVWVKAYEEELAPRRYVVGKERSALKVFSDNCAHSFFFFQIMLCILNTSGGFLEAYCSGESETILDPTLVCLPL